MRASREDQAKEICRGCPRRQECFNGALDRDEEYGIWGGHQFPYDAALEAARAARQTERQMAAALARARGLVVVAGVDSAGITSAPARQEVLAS